jgi:DNA-binding MarR family transcriptional regulator
LVVNTVLSSDRLTAWQAFHAAHAAVSGLLEEELAAERRLPLSWYDVLIALDATPEHRLRLHELAQAVALSRSGLTRMIDRMEREGLIRRESCADDGRGCFAALTDEGRTTLSRYWPIYTRGIEQHFVGLLDDSEARILAQALTRVAEAARQRGDVAELSPAKKGSTYYDR